MKKSIAFLCIISLTNTAFECESPSSRDTDISIACENSVWLDTIISNAKRGRNKGEVIQYNYNDETVFSINTCVECADAMTTVYNCAGETQCQFGGIAGLNTCPDFEDKATDKKVIWSN